MLQIDLQSDLATSVHNSISYMDMFDSVTQYISLQRTSKVVSWVA